MLRLAAPQDGETFVDMGSGTGKACVAAGLLFPGLAVSRGVELLTGLHKQAQVSQTISCARVEWLEWLEGWERPVGEVGGKVGDDRSQCVYAVAWHFVNLTLWHQQW